MSILSSFDELLERKEISLEDLLQEEKVINYSRNHKRSLVEFLSEFEIVHKLLDYFLQINQVPDDRLNLLYISTCYEILTSEIPEIEIHFYQNDFRLMHKLFDYFKHSELDRSHTDMVCKTIGTLLEGNSNGMLEFLQVRNDLFELLLNHIRFNSVLQLIIKFSKVEIYFDEYLEVFNNQNFIGQVIDRLSPNNEKLHFDTVYGIQDMIGESEEHCCGFINNFQSEENLLKLFEFIFSNSASSFVHGIKLINMFLQLALQNQYEYEDIQNLIDAIINHIPEFKIILSKEHKPTNIVGFNRIYILKLIRATIQFNNDTIFSGILKEDLISTMLDLSFFFDNNNILQRYVIDCFTIFLESNHQGIINELIEKKKIHDKILNYVKKEEIVSERKPIMPLLLEFAVELDKHKETNEILKTYLDTKEWLSLIEEQCNSLKIEADIQCTQAEFKEYNIDAIDI